MKEEIIRMAEEAEINLLFKGHPEYPERDSNDVIIFTGWVNHRTLRRFAALVAAAERQFIINFLESMHERCLGRHNYYLHAAKLISNLPSAKPTK